METLVVGPVDIEANCGEFDMHRIFRIVLKIDVDGQKAGLGRVDLVENLLDAGCVRARVRSHGEILMGVLGGDFRDIRLLRLRKQREEG